MIRKYTFGLPIDTNAVIAEIKSEDILSFPLELKTGERLQISFDLLSDEMIFGLGEAIRGINKRGWTYESWCSDETNHTEDKKALYGSHNFIVVGDRFALFVDFAGKVEWDLGYDKPDRAVITLDGNDADVYIIYGKNQRDMVVQFRKIIGKSYIPPRWAFGYQQSCWGYATQEDFYTVRDRHRENKLPLDAIYMDIDYMDSFKDFTVHPERFYSKHLISRVKRATPSTTRVTKKAISALIRTAKSLSAASGRESSACPTSSTPTRAAGSAPSTRRFCAAELTVSGTI